MNETNTYGLKWANATQLEVELFFIKNRGFYSVKGEKFGAGLFFHLRQAVSILWPDDSHTKWSDLILREYSRNEIIAITGCSDSGKTHTMSKIALTDYWASPTETLWLISTTEGRGSELRVWGAIKDLFNSARERFPTLPGNPIDYIKTITTDSIDESGTAARSLRRGLIVVPCKTGGTVSGLAPYIGIKAKRLRHLGDEVQAMNESFLNAYANWYGKEDFKGMMAGNFMETDDPLGLATEPIDGWDSWEDSGKTQTWKTKFYGGTAIALDGRDSPNFDFPLDENGKSRFPFLIGQKKLDGVAATKGKDGWEWYSQCVGKPVKGADIWRVLSRDMCKKNKASEVAIWGNEAPMLIYCLDPAYGLGDLCVGRVVELGVDVDGIQIVNAKEPEIIPIKLNIGVEAEDQIAAFVVKRLVDLKIPPERCGFDAFGKGALISYAFSRILGTNCPIPIDTGARPTSRPVRHDMFIEEHDTATGQKKKRLMRCDEFYTKFISELYFSVREAVLAGQIRGLDADSISEGCGRKFSKNNHNKIEVEPKEDYKARHQGKSPDKMDNFVIGVEMARRLGFRIQKLGGEVTIASRPKNHWLNRAEKAAQKLQQSRRLQAA